ncbi:M48 family metalloprotease [Noviherbaspirillum aridicola]|uniref:Peptidase M48 domain-containing protein n=1 Tax=Noviherbaspirillum aridicola TaxID=2849687 RepID=A0ABQ4Q0G0_9BURK|nr:M48 family metalloprotease [Noviherbaspirillum aridicola]GIZ50643.1 hypothetical protein NCCP691_06570 [Noviherbaspirillum aridicola]
MSAIQVLLTQSRARLMLLPVAVLFTACATSPTPPAPQAQPKPVDDRPVAAAPTPEETTVRNLAALQDRLYRVAGPLLTNNTALCKAAARNLLGFTAKNRHSYSPEYAAAAQKVLGLSDRLQVMGVLSPSGAERAGVQRGDTLLTVEDQPLPEGANAERQAAGILAPLVSKRSAVAMTVLRNGGAVQLNVPLTNACGFGVELGNSDAVNAWSDGYRVMITRGMMNHVRNDDELAYVMARELAHNILAHPSRRKLSATLGGIIDNLTRIRPDTSSMSGMAGVKPVPQDMDAMADRLALYLLARANYNLDGVIPFWQRTASQYPATVLNAYTAQHPATAARVAAMDKALKDIRAKQAANRPLVP